MDKKRTHWQGECTKVRKCTNAEEAIMLDNNFDSLLNSQRKRSNGIYHFHIHLNLSFIILIRHPFDLLTHSRCSRFEWSYCFSSLIPRPVSISPTPSSHHLISVSIKLDNSLICAQRAPPNVHVIPFMPQEPISKKTCDAATQSCFYFRYQWVTVSG